VAVRLQDIERLLDEGADAIPVNGKEAACSWKERIDYTREMVRYYYEKLGCDVALATGARNGIVVMDYDNPEAKEHGLSVCKPTGRIVGTPRGGEHHYYLYPGVEIRNAQNLGVKGCDRRGDGGYVKAPPSPGYILVSDAEMETYDPSWFPLQVREPMAALDGPSDEARGRARLYVSRIRAEEGIRDVTAFRVACVLIQKFGLPPGVALEEMRVWNQACCTPGLSEDRLRYKCSEAERLKYGSVSNHSLDR